MWLQVVEATSEPDVWTRLADFAPVIGGLLVVLGVGVTVWQKDKTDQRNIWWDRVEWSAEQWLNGGNDRQAIGMVALATLAQDQKRNPADRELLRAIFSAQLAMFSRVAESAPDVQFEVDEEP